MIEFDSKMIYTHSLWDRDVGDDIVEQANDQIVHFYYFFLASGSHVLTPFPCD